jgi:hypothetical protein
MWHLAGDVTVFNTTFTGWLTACNPTQTKCYISKDITTENSQVWEFDVSAGTTSLLPTTPGRLVTNSSVAFRIRSGAVSSDGNVR